LPGQKFPAWKALYPFVIGGTAATSATCIIQPIDMVKVRFQLQGEGGAGGSTNPIKMLGTIIKTEGVGALYTGLSAGIVRQLTYGMSRLGIFQTLSDRLKLEDGSLPFERKLGASLCAGGLGALIGTPADAALVRMQADTVLPAEQRRNYKHAGDALMKMMKNEGITGFFSGATPTILRGLSINVGMLTTYDAYKDFVGEKTGDPTSQTTRFAAGALSGWTAATVSLPFDFIKTRLQKQQKLPDGTYPMKGVIDCATQVVRKEGPLAFYAGYATYCFRITPHIMLTWVFLDTLKDIGWLK
jgi:solute carrier family 25 oxoglutarate transporter 11